MIILLVKDIQSLIA